MLMEQLGSKKRRRHRNLLQGTHREVIDRKRTPAKKHQPMMEYTPIIRKKSPRRMVVREDDEDASDNPAVRTMDDDPDEFLPVPPRKHITPVPRKSIVPPSTLGNSLIRKPGLPKTVITITPPLRILGGVQVEWIDRDTLATLQPGAFVDEIIIRWYIQFF